MNIADGLILIVVVLSALLSLKRGFVREALSLAKWLSALVVALLFYGQLAFWLEGQIALPMVRQGVAFILLFVGTLVVGTLVVYLVGELVDMSGLTTTDRLLGMGFGALRGAILILVLLMILPDLLDVRASDWWQESRLIPHFLLMEDWARRMGAELGQLFRQVIHGE